MADDEETPSITYEYMDGEQETTTWLKRAGKCKITYPSGAIYEGQVNDLKEKHGLGKYTYPSEPKEDGDEEEEGAEDAPRTVYEGQWLNGKKVCNIVINNISIYLSIYTLKKTKHKLTTTKTIIIIIIFLEYNTITEWNRCNDICKW